MAPNLKITYTSPVVMLEFCAGELFYEVLLCCEFHQPNVSLGASLTEKFSQYHWICDECWLQNMSLLRRHKRRYG